MVLCGCVPDPDRLVVDVSTDLVAGLEFDRVEVAISLGPSATRFVDLAEHGRQFLDEPLRVELDAPAGLQRVQVRLMREGERRLVANFLAEIEGITAQEVVLLRSCLGVECATGQNCLNAACVPEGCLTGFESECDSLLCRNDTECPVPTALCLQAVCLAGGACAQREPEAACAEGEYCDVSMGCTAFTTVDDAGVMDGAGEPDPCVAPLGRACGNVLETALKATNADVSDAMGASVAVSGNTVAVGVPAEASVVTGVLNSMDGASADNSAEGAGAVYVFLRTSPRSWRLQAYIKASNTDADDGFGSAVALDGNTLVVGAPREDSGNPMAPDDGLPDSGAVYVFERSGTRWTQTAFLEPATQDENDGFGSALALAGDVLAVGAPGEDSAAGDPTDDSRASAGAVYVFARDAGTWSAQAFIKPETAGAGDEFGRVLALDGATLVVGAPLEDGSARGVGGDASDDGAVDAGAVYVFVASGESWVQQAYIKAFNCGAEDRFGAAVAIAGDTLVVGAPRESSPSDQLLEDDSLSRAGAAYVFLRTSENWSFDSVLKPANAFAEMRFGSSVGVQGGRVAVGAPGESTNLRGVRLEAPFVTTGATASGALFLFEQGPGGWGQMAHFKHPAPDPDDACGASLDYRDDSLVMVCPGDDGALLGAYTDNSNPDSGALFIFDLRPSG